MYPFTPLDLLRCNIALWLMHRGNSARLGRFHSTCTSTKIHLEAQEAIIVSKLGVISSVKYGCEISVSKFVNCKSFHRVCSIRNIVLVTSMYKFTESHPSHSHKEHGSVNAAFKISKHNSKRLCIVQIFSLRKVVLMKHRPCLCCWSWYSILLVD